MLATMLGTCCVLVHGESIQKVD